MTKSRRGRVTVAVGESEDAEEAWGDEPVETERALTKAAAPTRTSPRDPQTIGARRFFGARVGQDPIVRSFVAVDQTAHGNRKLTREEWVEAFQSFRSAPR